MSNTSDDLSIDLDSDLHPDSRLWVYQSVPPIPEENREEIKEALHSFAKQWASHDKALRAEGHLLFDRFIVLIADETKVQASGCSIDSSVHFLKSLEAHYDLNLFDRMQFSYIDSEQTIQTCSSDEFSKAYQSGKIDDLTPVFDHTIQRKRELEEEWIKPLRDSFHKRFL